MYPIKYFYMTNFENEKLKRYFIKNHISKEAFQNIFQISQNIFLNQEFKQ